MPNITKKGIKSGAARPTPTRDLPSHPTWRVAPAATGKKPATAAAPAAPRTPAKPAAAIRPHTAPEPDEAQRPDPPDAPPKQAKRDRASEPRGGVPVEVVPCEAELRDPRLAVCNDPESERAAAFRVLRYRLFERDAPTTVAITSPGPRQGKSLAAANLALALSEAGRGDVLLIDAHLRAPELAQMFGVEPPSCFSEQLGRRRRGELKAWRIADIGRGVHLLATSTDTEGPRHLEAAVISDALAELTAADYCHVILDAPPVLGTADVNALQSVTDGVLLTALARTTHAASVQGAIEQLTRDKLLGMILIEN